MEDHLTQKSKQLSYILRHRPDSCGLSLDREGWAEIDLLVKKTAIPLQDILQIVKMDSKQRYSLQFTTVETTSGELIEVPTKIRANQGHSVGGVAIQFKKAIPPVTLFHGTPTENVPQILKQGLKPMSRHHVHLTPDAGTALSVGGRRRGAAKLLVIDTKSMLADNFTFYISDNGVWLVDLVPPKYIKTL